MKAKSLTAKLIIRIDPRLLARLRRAARSDRRNVSDWLRVTLDELIPPSSGERDAKLSRPSRAAKSKIITDP